MHLSSDHMTQSHVRLEPIAHEVHEGFIDLGLVYPAEPSSTRCDESGVEVHALGHRETLLMPVVCRRQGHLPEEPVLPIDHRLFPRRDPRTGRGRGGRAQLGQL